MTASTAPARYPRAAIAQVITEALAGLDFAHVAEWSTEGCPCQEAGQSCVQYRLHDLHGCRGHAEDIPLPPDQSLTADELVNALPAPDHDGLVDGYEAGQALAALASARLSDDPYRLRQLARKLAEALDEYEGTAPAPVTLSPGQLRCQYCTAPIPPERGPAARYCKNSHRVIAYKMRKREAEKAANTAAAGAR